MSKGYMLRGGGSGVNLSVKSYATKNNLPVRAPENAVGVISNVPVSKYDFTGIQPGNPIEGEVWIKTAAVVNPFTFNLLHKNELLVSPVIVWQYTKGKWGSRNAYIFQKGKWTILTVYLIENGSYTSYIPQFTVDSYRNPKVTINQTSSYQDIIIYYGDTSFSNFPSINSPPIEFGGYKKMIVECETGQGITSPVEIYKGSSPPDLGLAIVPGGKRRLEIDLKNFNTTDSFSFSISRDSKVRSVTFRIYSIWLE